MAGITDLPQELVDSIIPLPYKPTAANIRIASLAPDNSEDFTFFERRRALLSLGSTCRSLHRMLRDDLYGVVFITGQNKFQKMLKLLRAIDKDSELQVFGITTQLCICPNNSDDDDTEKSYRSLRPKDIEYLKSATRKAGFTTVEKFWDTSKHEYPGEYHGPLKGKLFGHDHRLGLISQIILSRLPKIEGIEIPMSMLTMHYPAPKKLQAVRHSIRSLALTETAQSGPRLEHVSKELGLFYKFRLGIKELCYENSCFGIEEALFSFTMITRLVLHCCKFQQTEVLEPVFKKLKHLETLVYTSDGKRAAPETVVGYLIRHRSATLRTLVIECPLTSYEHLEPVKSFEGLSVLSDLWIRGSNVVCSDARKKGQAGVRSLPRTLRRLHIKGITAALMRDAEWLRNEIGARLFPVMMEVAMEYDEPVPGSEKAGRPGLLYKTKADPYPWMWDTSTGLKEVLLPHNESFISG
ncbi:hypothetical protein CkaCkLH20_10659 [Colletotrichum karsti]|uniref:Uncharacterized protein n=1 Tax=Colletotrichum karsti TaxID=1095194 RepID=A0A9P6LGM0_9PEZI|nr:uncharacterized protein CkaCkLH20_10659 [Colletotrichum karsti]KAF9871725.1 hypothetical protein CkaCkLH20_10659 [Colletotrichum karsti]